MLKAGFIFTSGAEKVVVCGRVAAADSLLYRSTEIQYLCVPLEYLTLSGGRYRRVK